MPDLFLNLWTLLFYELKFRNDSKPMLKKLEVIDFKVLLIYK